MLALTLSACQKSPPDPAKLERGELERSAPARSEKREQLDQFLAPPPTRQTVPLQPPKLDFYYPHPFAKYDDDCQEYFVAVDVEYSEAETKAQLAEVFSAYKPFMIVSGTPKAKLEIKIGTRVGPESEGSTALLVQCFERLPCVALAGILSVDDRPFSLLCEHKKGKAPEFERAWPREEILAARTPGKPINDCARIVHCAAYEFEWGAMKCERFSSSVIRECASKATCEEVANCIEPHERAGDVKERAAPRRRTAGDIEQQSSPSKPLRDWEF